jgi:hypothetical protein
VDSGGLDSSNLKSTSQQRRLRLIAKCSTLSVDIPLDSSPLEILTEFEPNYRLRKRAASYGYQC